MALGPTTAGPSNISQARTMAWPSTEIDLSRYSPVAQKNSYSPFIYLRSLQPYSTTTFNYNNHNNHNNSRYSNAYLIIPISSRPTTTFLIQHQPTNTTQSICVPLPSSLLSLLLPSPLALTALTASTTSLLLSLRRPSPTALVSFAINSSSCL